MLFDVEEDSRHCIVGYFVPDSFSRTPSLKVIVDEAEVLELAPNEIRQSVVAAGRHKTGQVGFRIEESIVKDLQSHDRLALADAESGLTIYRRQPTGTTIPRKIFRLETRLLRELDLDRLIDSRFQLTFPHVDQYGRETATQSLLLTCTQSLYVSARVNFKEYEYSMDTAFSKICILQDPYIELAETLIYATTPPDARRTKDLRNQLSMEACSEYLASLDLHDLKQLNRSLGRLPPEVETALQCPMVRLLSSRSTDDSMNAASLATSLETLASFDIIGVRERPATFLAPLGELLECDTSGFEFTPVSAQARKLAIQLRQSRAVDALLEFDIELYRRVQSILDKAYDSMEPGGGPV